MKQTLHIFLKDSRRFWLEILVSLAVLVAFVTFYPEQWGAKVSNLNLPSWVSNTATTLVPISWWLLISRVIHAENLVGVNQFWITRPYRWQSLLLAKVLFIFTYVQLPFFFALCVMLRMAGFQIAGHFGGLAFNVLMATCIVIVPLFLVLTVTGSFAKMILWLLSIFAFAGGMGYLSTLLPTANASTDYGGYFSAAVIESCFLAIILLQYTSRKTRLSRVLVVIAALAIGLFVLVGPDDLPIRKTYPLAVPGAASVVKIEGETTKDIAGAYSEDEVSREVEMTFPLRVSEIKPNTAIKVDAARVAIFAKDGMRWQSHWQGVYLTWLPGQTGASIKLKVSRAFYEQHRDSEAIAELSLAMTVAKAGAVTRVKIPDGSFVIPGGAICTRGGFWSGEVGCRSPLKHPPLLMVATKLTTNSCSADRLVVSNGDTELGWIGDLNTDPAEFGFTSVWTSDVNFQQIATGESQGRRQYLCPGSVMAFAPYTLLERREEKVQIPSFTMHGLRTTLNMM